MMMMMILFNNDNNKGSKGIQFAPVPLKQLGEVAYPSQPHEVTNRDLLFQFEYTQNLKLPT